MSLEFLLFALAFALMVVLPAALVMFWNPMHYRERLAWFFITLFTSWIGVIAFMFYVQSQQQRRPRVRSV